MKKKKEVKYINKLFDKMQQQFESFAETQNPEALHDFRVQVKKTKSFLTLLQATDKNTKLLKTFRPVKKLFRQTGVIRDAYIHQKQAHENNIDAPQFFKEQSELQQHRTDELLNRHHKLLGDIQKVKRQLRHRVHNISNNSIENFFVLQIHNAEELLSSHHFTEQLHSGRKMLKHMLYNRHIIPPVIAKDIKINFNDVDVMQQVIGDWHDNKLALDYFSNKMPDVNLEALEQKQQELRKKVILSSDAFIKHAQHKPMLFEI